MSGQGIEFIKMSGCGNDFVMIDGVKRQFTGDLSELARLLCERRTGVWADGLILLTKGGQAPFAVRIINSDGSEAEMCGNAARCVVRFAQLSGYTGSEISFETLAGVIRGRLTSDGAEISMTPPQGERFGIELDADDAHWTASFINTGVPHVAVFVENVSAVDVDRVGRAIRRHPEFAPAGTNVDFVQVLGPDRLRMRTYERGVEGKTQACGTGAVAGAALARLLKKVKADKIAVEVPGGVLQVGLEFAAGKLSGATLAGEARVVFRGVTE